MRGELLEAERVNSIVGAFYRVYNYYGFGLSEAIYAGALEYELGDRGHEVVRELAVPVAYLGRHVAWQRLDMVVDNRVIVEIKAMETLSKAASRQLITYLRATVFEVGVLLHFGEKPSFDRFVDFPKDRPANRRTPRKLDRSNSVDPNVGRVGELGDLASPVELESSANTNATN